MLSDSDWGSWKVSNPQGVQEVDLFKTSLFDSPDGVDLHKYPVAHITRVLNQHYVLKSTWKKSASDVKDLTLSQAFHISYPFQHPFSIIQRTAVPLFVSRNLMSPCLKLHHPANRDTSVHHHSHIPTGIAGA